MPNHVTNILRFECSEQRRNEVLVAVHGNAVGDREAEIFDFDKLIPMPPELAVESGSIGSDGVAIIEFRNGNNDKLEKIMEHLWVKDVPMIKTLNDLADYLIERNPDCIKIGQAYLDNMDKYGASNWYEWSLQNWGTKWGAYDISIDNGQFTFSTAWSAPFPVIKKLSEMFPDIIIHHAYADEDMGHNCGSGRWANSGSYYDHPEFGTPEARKFAIAIKCGHISPDDITAEDLESWGMDEEGNWFEG